MLLDLDNLALRDGQLLPAGLVGRRLDDVARMAGPCSYRIAIAPPRTLGTYAPQLAERGVPLRACGTERDAADLALCVEGFELLMRGYTALVVASGDHFFAQLADVAPLYLAVPHGIPVSRQLAMASTPLKSKLAATAA